MSDCGNTQVHYPHGRCPGVRYSCERRDEHAPHGPADKGDPESCTGAIHPKFRDNRTETAA